MVEAKIKPGFVNPHTIQNSLSDSTSIIQLISKPFLFEKLFISKTKSWLNLIEIKTSLFPAFQLLKRKICNIFGRRKDNKSTQ